MSDPVVIAFITTVGVAVVSGIFQIINKKADKAKEEVNQNTIEVETVLKAMEGVKLLADQQRVELDRKEARIDQLEKDLIEEKSINVALERQLKKENQSGGTPSTKNE